MPNTENDRFAKFLCFKIESTSKDYAVVSVKVQENFLNGVDIAHGGFIFSLCDYASAIASNTDERIAISSNASIDYISPIPINSTIYAYAEALVVTEKSGVYNVIVADKCKTKTYAIFRCRVIFKPAK